MSVYSSTGLVDSSQETLLVGPRTYSGREHRRSTSRRGSEDRVGTGNTWGLGWFRDQFPLISYGSSFRVPTGVGKWIESRVRTRTEPSDVLDPNDTTTRVGRWNIGFRNYSGLSTEDKPWNPRGPDSGTTREWIKEVVSAKSLWCQDRVSGQCQTGSKSDGLRMVTSRTDDEWETWS